jgi:APA family basic amino acid/polyamine antiporter
MSDTSLKDMQSGGLKRTLSAPQFFAISFATIVGVGWIVVLGEWLRLAGPVGAILAFLAAGVVMIVIGACYAEVCTSIPAAGGEMAYAYAAFGPRAAFATGWLLALVYVSATAFEGLSVGWLAGILFPPLAGRVLYHVLGMPVTSGTLTIGIGGTLALTAVNCHGIQSSGRLQGWVTWEKVAVAGVLIGAGLLTGHVENLNPAFAVDPQTGGVLRGTLAVFVTAPFWLAGFNTVAQLMEERASTASPKSVVTALLASIGVAASFYALLILSAAMAMPWHEIARLEFPAIGAFAAALHSEFAARTVLLLGLVGLLATWNGVFLAASRLLYALARAGMIRHELARVRPRSGVPAVAVVIVGLLSAAGILLGRSVLLPIISMDAGCFMLVYAGVALAVIRLRRRDPGRPRPYRVPGGSLTALFATAAALSMFVASEYLAWAGRKALIPAEWQIFVAWMALGVAASAFGARGRAPLDRAERHRLIMGDHAGNVMAPGPAD